MAAYDDTERGNSATGERVMTATTFNPLATVRDLEAAGIERRQAEVITEGMRQAADAAASAGRGDLATRADLSGFATKTDLYREIGALRSEMRWMFGFQVALILAIAAKLFGIV